MPNFDSLFNAFVTILVTIDPPGLAPLFLAVTRGMNREERQQVSVRASVIGFLVMALFAVSAVVALALAWWGDLLPERPPGPLGIDRAVEALSPAG